MGGSCHIAGMGELPGENTYRRDEFMDGLNQPIKLAWRRCGPRPAHEIGSLVLQNCSSILQPYRNIKLCRRHNVAEDTVSARNS